MNLPKCPKMIVFESWKYVFTGVDHPIYIFNIERKKLLYLRLLVYLPALDTIQLDE
jgi:hypothetical protein